jgi:prevent-host-death family protein
MRIVNMLDAKSNLSKLVESVESGEQREIIIARNGKPAAKLVAIGHPAVGQRLGIAKGRFEVPEDIDATNPEVAALFAPDGPR